MTTKSKEKTSMKDTVNKVGDATRGFSLVMNNISNSFYNVKNAISNILGMFR